MQINREFVVALRNRKSWSQAELAIAAGLNLRTIQRIEAEGVASLQSRKALASAFDVEIDELVQRKVPAMTKYEYKQVGAQADGPDDAGPGCRLGAQQGR